MILTESRYTFHFLVENPKFLTKCYILLTFLHILRFYGIVLIPKIEFFFYFVNCISVTCN